MGLPPLWGGEITIIMFGCLFLRRKTIASFLNTKLGFPVFMLILLPLPYILIDYQHAGIKCFEYASICYYAVFIFFGYASITSIDTSDKFIKIVYWGILLSILHFLISRVVPLQQITPSINGVSLLGHNDSGYIYYTFGLAYCIIYFNQIKKLKLIILLCSLVLAYIVHFERGPILGFTGCLLVLCMNVKVWYEKMSIGKISIIFVSIFLLVIIGVFISTHAPDLGLVSKIKQQKNLALSIFGLSDNPNLRIQDGTREHRLEMWHDIYIDTIRKDFFFGQGFSEVLVEGAIRHPHNSFITFFGRIGTLGLSLAIYIYCFFPVFVFFHIRDIESQIMKKRLLLFLCFVPAFLSAALFGPTLEAPYSALVCNFMYGVMLRVYCLSKGNAQYAWH